MNEIFAQLNDYMVQFIKRAPQFEGDEELAQKLGYWMGRLEEYAKQHQLI